MAFALGAGCQTPVGVSDGLAAAQGATKERLNGATFAHIVYRRVPARSIERLHIYIEGDGTPWQRGQVPALDPTARRPLALELMAKDPAPAIYLGRPCYLGLAREPACEPRWWTFERYAPAVVTSLSAALAALLDDYPGAVATLIGYSGGGVLALLVAESERRVDTVVTIASNLDTDAWTDALGYLPLTGSVNPARIPGWRGALRQIHVAGGRDRQVPATVVARFVSAVTDRAGAAPAELHVIDHFDHACCWVDVWPQLLHDVTAADIGDRRGSPSASD